ncbi:hypothetical protein D3C72_826270 [compost metagenome]
MSNRVALIDTYGWKGYYYYLLFPLDLMRPDTDDQLAYQETKLTELLPILGWLVPILVLLTGTTTSMGFFGLIFFFAVEAAILALITKFHLKLAWNQTTELWLSLWAGMCAMMVALAVLLFFFGVFTNPDIEWESDD